MRSAETRGAWPGVQLPAAATVPKPPRRQGEGKVARNSGEEGSRLETSGSCAELRDSAPDWPSEASEGHRARWAHSGMLGAVLPMFGASRLGMGGRGPSHSGPPTRAPSQSPTRVGRVLGGGHGLRRPTHSAVGTHTRLHTLRDQGWLQNPNQCKRLLVQINSRGTGGTGLWTL